MGMKRLVSTVELEKDDWLRYRKKRIINLRDLKYDWYGSDKMKELYGAE